MRYSSNSVNFVRILIAWTVGIVVFFVVTPFTGMATGLLAAVGVTLATWALVDDISIRFHHR